MEGIVHAKVGETAYKKRSFKHSGGRGDVIYSLPTVIVLAGGTFYLSGGGSMMTEILEVQPYIKEVKHFKGSREEWKSLKVDYNLDGFRNWDHRNNLLTVCHLKAFNLLGSTPLFNLSQPWLYNIEPKHIRPIVINKNLSYPGDNIDWDVLKGYEKKCVFLGLVQEYDSFIKMTGLNIPRHVLNPETALEFASIIKGSDIYIGNQSLGFSLAEGMKHPRVLEIYMGAPNCTPQSENGYELLTEEVLQRYLK